MDELIKSRMDEDEKILWQGGPDTIKALDKTNKKRFWVQLIIGAAVAAVLIALYALNVKDDPKPSVFAIILVICFFAPLRRLADAAAVRKLQYVVTDKRLMIVSSEARHVTLPRIQECALRTDEDGHLSFLAGPGALKARPSHWRDLSLIGQGTTEPDEPVNAFGFYAVKDKAGLRKALRQVLPDVKE